MSAEIYVFNSSSKGNCCLIKSGGEVILIDAGVSAKRIREASRDVGISLDEIRAVVITHEHTDHIKGLETLYHSISAPIYAPPLCAVQIKTCCPSTIPFLVPTEPKSVIELERNRIYTVPTPHDSVQSVGFRMDLCGETFSYFTDIGHLTSDIIKATSGCSRLVIESNHDIEMLKNGSYPSALKQRILGPNGHLSNQSCAEFLPHLAQYGTRRIMLAHLSEENNTPELAYETNKKNLQDCVSLQVASPYFTKEL